VYNWSEINPVLFREHPELFRQLEEVYGTSGLSDIDLYVGGMLESHEGPGPLFRYSAKLYSIHCPKYGAL
jgi:dual oxidase